MNRLSVFAGGCDLRAAGGGPARRRPRRARCGRRVGSAGRQVPRRRRRRRRRGAVPAARDHPPVRAGATRREWRGGRRFDVATPTTTSRWPKRPVRTCGAESTSSGPTHRARHRQLPRCARLGRRDTVARARVAPGRPAGGARHRSGTRDGLGRNRRRRSPTPTTIGCFPTWRLWATWSATARGDLALADQYAATIDDAEARFGAGSATACRGPAVLAILSRRLEHRSLQVRGVGRTITSQRRRLRVVPGPGPARGRATGGHR